MISLELALINIQNVAMKRLAPEKICMINHTRNGPEFNQSFRPVATLKISLCFMVLQTDHRAFMAHFLSVNAACAAASLAIGTRYGEHDT